MKEIKGGFRKSQLIDTQIISKYAMHYLKTYFNSVDVQKGVVTAEFRKIFGIQEVGTEKDRSKHSHHAKDAIVLSLIPPPAIREQMLTIWYKIKEHEDLLKSNTENNRKSITEDITRLKEELQLLKYQCNLPNNVNRIIESLDETILINNIAKDQSLTKSKKRVRNRGKAIPLKVEKKVIYKTDESGNNIQRTYKDGKLVYKNDEFGNPLLDANGNPIPVLVPKEKWAKGDSIRGQLHLDTFYGKIKKVQRDKDENPIKDEQGNYLFVKENDGIACVLKKEVNSNLNVEKIVDPHLKDVIITQLNGRTVEKAIKEDGGLWMLKKDGSRAHKIRHIRCFEDTVTDPIGFKEQTHKSNKEYKNLYWAKNGENIICALYQKIIIDKKGAEKTDRELEIITLSDAADILSLDLIDEDRQIELYRKDKNKKEIINQNSFKEKPYALLKPGMKVIFYDNELYELKPEKNESTHEYYKRVSPRIYFIRKFYGAQIFFQHHLEARSEEQLKKDYPEKAIFKIDEKGNEITYGKRGINGFTESISNFEKLNKGQPWHRLLYSKDWLNVAIEGKHFAVNPYGEIDWIKTASAQ